MQAECWPPCVGGEGDLEASKTIQGKDGKDVGIVREQQQAPGQTDGATCQCVSSAARPALVCRFTLRNAGVAAGGFRLSTTVWVMPAHEPRGRFWKTTTTQAYAAHLNIFLRPRSSCHTARSHCNLLVSDGGISTGHRAAAACTAANFCLASEIQ